MKLLKRVSAFMLALALVFTSLSLTAYADSADDYIKVTFDANGGLFSTDVTTCEESVHVGETIPASCQTRPYYADGTKIFAGWMTEANSTELYDGSKTATAGQNEILYANWINAVSVTLNPNGGSFADGTNTTVAVPKHYSMNELNNNYLVWEAFNSLSTASITAPDGKVFAGWALDAEGNKRIESISDYHFDEDVELFAVWKSEVKLTIVLGDSVTAINRNSISDWPLGVRFYNATSNGGYYEFNVSGTSEDGTTVSFSVPAGSYYRLSNMNSYENELSVPAGTTFLGWAEDAKGNALLASTNNNYLELNENTTLYAIWGDGVRITLDANGGKFIDGTTQRECAVAENSKIELHSSFQTPYSEDTNKEFYGWSTSTDESGLILYPENVTYQVGTEDLNLHAIYRDRNNHNITITYDCNGKGYFGRATGNTTTYATTDYGVKSTTVSLRNYPFTYSNLSKMFVANDGSALLGWSTNPNATEVSDYSTTVTEDTTLYPVLGQGYRVTLDPGDASWETAATRYQKDVLYINKVAHPKGADLSLLNSSFGTSIYSGNTSDVFVKPAGKMFVGWTKVKNDKSTLIKYGDTLQEDITLYAYFENAVVITLDANGGYFSGSEKTKTLTYTVPEGSFQFLHDYPTINGDKVFAGWSKNPDGSDVVLDCSEYIASLPIDSAKTETYYAIYKDAYTVTFYANGGKFSDKNRTTDATKVLAGKTIKYTPAITREGKVLVGFTDAKPGQKVTKDTLILSIHPFDDDSYYKYVPTKNMSLYPIWADAIEVTLDAGDDGYFMDYVYDEETHMGKTVQVATKTVTVPKGYITEQAYMPNQKDTTKYFAGYSKTPNGEVEVAYDTELSGFTFNEAGTYYAIFKDQKDLLENNTATTEENNTTTTEENNTTETPVLNGDVTAPITAEEKTVVPTTAEQAETKAAKFINSLRAQLEGTTFAEDQVEASAGVMIESIEQVKDENAINSLQQIVTSIMKSAMETQTTIQEVKLVELNAKGSGAVRFLVGKEYAGVYAVVGHFHDGVWTTQQCLVDRNGYITPNFVSFSPIAIMLTNSTAALENLVTASEPTVVDDATAAANREEVAQVVTAAAASDNGAQVAGAASAASVATAVKSPATGDTAVDMRAILAVLCFLAAALLYSLAQEKKNA